MAQVKPKNVLTEGEAEELAGYIEQLQREDLSKGRPGPGVPGRPSLTVGRAEHSPSIHVRLPEKLYRSLSRREKPTAHEKCRLICKGERCFGVFHEKATNDGQK